MPARDVYGLKSLEGTLMMCSSIEEARRPIATESSFPTIISNNIQVYHIEMLMTMTNDLIM